MRKKITIELPEIPPDLNKIVAMLNRNRFVYSSEKKRWKEMMHLLTCSIPVFKNKIDIYLTCIFPDKRSRDRDNYWACWKFVLDGLSCVSDDNSELVEPHLRQFVYEKGVRRAFIEIIEQEET
jgi:Holliday junction resolvase RusA-like endonuclease